MKLAVPSLLAFLLVVLTESQVLAQVHCGTERWAAKGLTDGSTIDFNTRTSTTVAHLAGLHIPSGVAGMSAPRTAPEKHVYIIHALLKEFAIEGDHDFHLVISDFGGPKKVTMIAEVPDGACDGVRGDGWTSEFASIRSAMQSKFGTVTTSPTFKTVNAEVTLTGVLFFDRPHAYGAPKNGVELHPVIGFALGASPVPVTTSPAPVPISTPSGGLADEQSVQATCPHDSVVWVNTHSGLYHAKGSRWYGTTRRGKYMCKHDADSAGYQNAFE